MAHLTGAAAFPHQTSETVIASSSAPTKIQFGTRARDLAGNEYIYVDFQTSFAIGEIGVIGAAWDFDKAATTSRGKIGIVVSTVSSSDYGGWVQVYGYNAYVLNNLAVCTTAAGVKPAGTTDGYSIVTVGTSDDSSNIVGMTCIADSTSATSPTSVLRYIKCTLTYPTVAPNFSS